MPPAVSVRRPRLPIDERIVLESKDIDRKRIAFCRIARMRGAAITTRAGRHTRKQIDLREEFDEIARPHRARLHEVFMSIARVAGAHKNIDHIVHVAFRIQWVHSLHLREGPGQIGMATAMVLTLSQHVMSVWITACPDHIVDTSAVFIVAVPVQGIVGNRCHRSEIRHVAPEAITGADVGHMQGTGLTAIEVFLKIRGIPKVQVPSLRAFHTVDTENVTGRHLEHAGISGRDSNRID